MSRSRGTEFHYPESNRALFLFLFFGAECFHLEEGKLQPGEEHVQDTRTTLIAQENAFFF